MQPPIDHRILASMRGIAAITEEPILWAGFLVPDPAGARMTLRSTDPWGKRRFTAFHEIKHTFMPGFSVEQFRCDPATPQEAVAVRNKNIEALCDLGAAELLFPRKFFRADLAGTVPSFSLVDDLADRYDASREATALRIVTLHDLPVVLVALETMRKPRDPFGRPKLRVKWAQAANPAMPFIPRYKSVTAAGVFGRALGGEPIDEIATVSILNNSLTRPMKVSARRSSYTDSKGEQHMRVLALLADTQASRAGHA